jgi:hypothetical protein
MHLAFFAIERSIQFNRHSYNFVSLHRHAGESRYPEYIENTGFLLPQE